MNDMDELTRSIKLCDHVTQLEEWAKLASEYLKEVEAKDGFVSNKSRLHALLSVALRALETQKEKIA